MQNIYKKIQSFTNKKKKRLLAFAIIFMIFQAIWIFPFKYELSLSYASILYTYFIIGFILCATLKKKLAIVLMTIISTNMLGLCLRVWLEWGEYSMTRDLTVFNVLSTYIPIIAVIAVSYIYTLHYIENESQVAS
jgi:hypothetical protein